MSMPPSHLSDTLPDRPGDKPERLIANAVSITCLRAAVSPAIGRLRLSLSGAASRFAALRCLVAFGFAAGAMPVP